MRSRTIPNTTLPFRPLLGLLFLLAGALLSACAWFHPWEAPTTYEFVGLKSSEAVYVENVFRKRGVTFRRLEREPPTYEVSGIAKMKDLAGLHRAIDKTIVKNDLQVDFREATIRYSGLSGGGEVSTSVTINVTPPDAIVHIADGQRASPWRRVEVDSRGTWSGPVTTAGVVTETGGWLYVHAKRGSLERIFRVNVLSQRQERWLGDLPFDTPKSE